MQFLPAPSLWAASLLLAPQSTTRNVWGKPSGRSRSCCSWAEQLHCPRCVLEKRPVQPRGCRNCFKQLYCCFFTARRRQFLGFPLLDPCQQITTTLKAFILPFLRGWLLHPKASWLTLATVPRHSKPGRMPPGWKCHKLLFAKGKEQFLYWPHCEMRNVFPTAARAQSRELKTFSLSLPNIFQSLHIKYFQLEKKNQEGVAWRFPTDTEIIAESKPPYSLGATGTTNYSPKIQLRFLSLFI